MKQALPYIWIWRRDPETGHFFCRVCGEHVNYIFRRNFSGKTVDEALPADRAAEAQARWRRVIDGRIAHHLVGCVYHYSDRQVMGERPVLPLAPSRNDAGGVLGATDAAPPALRMSSPADPGKFVGIGVGERRDYDADPARLR